MSFSQIGNSYDDNVRKVIPLYDEIHAQVIDLIADYTAGKPVALLDTGCGSGTFAARAAEELQLSELVLCDPLAAMLDTAKQRLAGRADFYQTGSEGLEFEERFDVVTAIQSHHYFQPAERRQAVANCFRALRPGGIFICFENTAADTEQGKQIMLRRVERYSIAHGRSEEEAKAHTLRYGTEYFPLTVAEHLALLRETGFQTAELFWRSYLQCGFYAIKAEV
ncbi:MAG: class I SAM-dependent methyltransferase [Oscillospiraceae bacterium]|nr:class I SAM-dependent methyltransferase [Oscillospiraceae bacterium]